MGEANDHRIRGPLLPSDQIACPACDAEAGYACHGIDIHPEHGPMGVHTARLEAARGLAERKSGGAG